MSGTGLSSISPFPLTPAPGEVFGAVCHVTAGEEADAKADVVGDKGGFVPDPVHR